MTEPVRIPSDVDREDRVVAGLTARQVTILAATGLMLYAAWTLTRTVVPLGVFLIGAVPVGAVVAVLALGQRDGLSLDRLLLAAIRQRLSPQHQVAAPEGIRRAPDWLTTHATSTDTDPTDAPSPLQLPARTVTDTGVVDLGDDGLALVAVVSTVNFALRTPAEQEALVASFGRYLHSLTAPVQILVRAERLDLSAQIADLRDRAGGLAHPALEAAAFEHADYVAHLAETADLLQRQFLLVLREPWHTESADALTGGPPWASLFQRGTTRPQAGDAVRRAAEARLVRRIDEAVALLAPAGIVVTPLDAGAATAVLAAACDPGSLPPPAAGCTGADEVITSPGPPDDGDEIGDEPGELGVRRQSA